MSPGLALALAQVAERMKAGRADPPTPEMHPVPMQALGECIEWDAERRKQQEEAANPAA